MEILKVLSSLAFSINKEETLKNLSDHLKSDYNFFHFFVELNDFDKKFLESGLIERLEKLPNGNLMFYYNQLKDSQFRNLVRVVLLTRGDFMKKMHEGYFTCI